MVNNIFFLFCSIFCNLMQVLESGKALKIDESFGKWGIMPILIVEGR